MSALPFRPRNVRLENLAAELKHVRDIDVVRELAEADVRFNAGPIYQARIDELTPTAPPSLDGASPAEVEKRGYRMGRWGHHPNYECLACGFATLEWHLIRAHVRRVHPGR